MQPLTTTTPLGGELAGIPPEWLGIGSGWLLLCLFLIGFYRALSQGRLVTRREADQIEQAAAQAVEKAEHDRDEWRAESRIKDVQITEKDQQLGEKDRQLNYLGEVGKTQEAVLSALQRMAAGEVDLR